MHACFTGEVLLCFANCSSSTVSSGALLVLRDTQRFIYSDKKRGRIVITYVYTRDLAALQVLVEVFEHRSPISSSISHDFTARPPQGRMQVSSGEHQERTGTYSRGSRPGKYLLRIWEWWHLSGLHRRVSETETKGTTEFVSALMVCCRTDTEAEHSLRWY